LSSFKRKLKRKASIKTAKYLKKNMNTIIQDAVNAKLSGLKKIPDKCDLCDLAFDKSSREQVFSWMLKVDEDRDVYNLFCPACYSKYYDQEEEVNNV